MELFFDGGANPNPGPGGAGALLLGPAGETVWEGSSFVGQRATNNEAEYRGLLAGLVRARELGATRVSVKGDSMLVIRQMQGAFKVKAPNLQPLHAEARALAKSFASITYEHIPRALNFRADRLATAGIALGCNRAVAAGAGAAILVQAVTPALRAGAVLARPASKKRARADDQAGGSDLEGAAAPRPAKGARTFQR